MKITFARKLAAIGVMALFGLTGQLQAASESAEGAVPIELVREIVGDGEFYERLPDGFPLPDITYLDGISLHLIGSWDTGFGATVFLRTSGNFGEAVNALRDAYAGNGWTDLSVPWEIGPLVSAPTLGIRGIVPVFSGSSQPASPIISRIPTTGIVRDPLSVYSLCHDELGSLGFQPTTNQAGGNGIRISYQPAAVSELIDPRSCQERQAYNDAGYPSGLASYFQTLLPVLDLPDGTVSASTSYGGTVLSTAARFFSLDSASNAPLQAGLDSRITVPGTNLFVLYEHYSLLLEEQGWTTNSSAIASESSSSVWVRTAGVPDNVPSGIEEFRLQGALTLLDSGDDSYHVWFRMTSR